MQVALPMGGVERLTRVRPFVRPAVAALLAYHTKRFDEVEQVAKEIFQHEPNIVPITRAATNLGTQFTSVAQTVVADFVSTCAQYAMPSLLSRFSQRYESDGTQKLDTPSAEPSADYAGFILAGDPIKGVSFTCGNAPLTRKKVGSIVAVTSELFTHSVPNIESVLRILLTDSIGLLLDKIGFDGAAADTTRPASILNGITPSSASNASVRSDAMASDVQTVTSAVMAASGNSPIILIAGVEQAAALRLMPKLPYELLVSSELDGKLVAVASNCLAAMFDSVPNFMVSNQGVAHLNTSPTQLTTQTGTAAVVSAYPVVSLWQADLIGLRTILGMDWAVRSSKGIAFIEGISAW